MEKINSILKYLFGDLPEKELLEFNKALAEDPEFAKQVAEIRKITERISSHLDLSAREDFNGKEDIIAAIMAEYDIETMGTHAVSKDEKQFKRKMGMAMQHPPESSRKRVRKITMYTLAAAASLALTLVVLFPERDFEHMLKSAYDPVADIMGEELNLSIRSEMDNGILLMEKGDYIHARLVFESNMDLTKSDTSLLMLYAITLFETAEEKSALGMLEQLTGNLATKYQMDAAWYRCMLLFRMSEDPEATMILEQLSANNSYYASAARRLLLRLEKEEPGRE